MSIEIFSMNKILYAKLFGAIILAVIVTKLITNNVFIADTPQIKPNLDKVIAINLDSLINDNIIARAIKGKPAIAEKVEKHNQLLQQFSNIPFQQVSKGVYAKNDDKTVVIEYRFGEADWLEYTFTINGKEIKIRVPKDEKPPSKEFLEKVYR